MMSLQKLRGSPLLLLLLLLLAGLCAEGHKPVVIVHGVMSGPSHYETLKNNIVKVHPGTEVHVIDLDNGLCSLKPMWKQVRDYSAKINSIMERATDGIHLICFSQGGLICRGLLSTTKNHNVHHFISLSSPQAGQYGIPANMQCKVPEHSRRESVFRFCYSTILSPLRPSVCDYWNDPHQRPLYLQRNKFLSKLNGDVAHDESDEWKENFTRIKKLVLIGGPGDDVITPWQSSQFGFYDINENVIEMRNQEFYTKDKFGLQTLDQRKDLEMCTKAAVKHVDWHKNEDVFKECIEPWLT